MVMKKYLYIILITLVSLSSNLLAQSLNKNTIVWGNDNVVLNYDPLGTFCGLQDSDGRIFVAINNKVSFPGGGIMIVTSDDYGVTWNVLSNDAGIVFDGDYKNFKLVQGPDNSVYLFAQIDYILIVKRIDELSGLWISQIQTNEFDVVYSDVLNKFLLLYVQPDNNLYFREIETQSGYFSAGTSFPLNTGIYSPKLTVDGNKIGISYMYNYFLPKESSPIVHYAGEIASNNTIGFFSPVNAVSEGSIKTEYKTAIAGDKVWVVYVENVNNQISIKGNFSMDGGATFSIPQNIALSISSNNYWVNLKKNKSGFDLVYYYDQPQIGISTNETDKIVYSYNANNSSSSYIYNLRVSSHFPFWSSNNQIPEIVPFAYSQLYDLGVLWIGYDPTGPKLFWNRFSSVMDVEHEKIIPIDFSLEQNYPNPFNPRTVINYRLPVGSFVSLKVYDVLGKEVAVLVNEYQPAGTYNSTFDTQGQLSSSGVYFYQLKAGKFVDTKKFVLQK